MWKIVDREVFHERNEPAECLPWAHNTPQTIDGMFPKRPSGCETFTSSSHDLDFRFPLPTPKAAADCYTLRTQPTLPSQNLNRNSKDHLKSERSCRRGVCVPRRLLPMVTGHG